MEEKRTEEKSSLVLTTVTTTTTTATPLSELSEKINEEFLLNQSTFMQRWEKEWNIYEYIYMHIYIDIYSSYLHFHSAALRTCCHNAEERRSVLYTPSLHSLGVSHGSFLCKFHIISVLMGKGNDLRVCVYAMLCYAMLWRTLHVGFLSNHFIGRLFLHFPQSPVTIITLYNYLIEIIWDHPDSTIKIRN